MTKINIKMLSRRCISKFKKNAEEYCKEIAENKIISD